MSKTPAQSGNRLDIFEQIRAVQRHEFAWLDNQPENLKKTFYAFILNRWMSGSNNPAAIMGAEIANKYVWALYDHPDLLWRLLCATGTIPPRDKKTWIKATNKNTVKSSILNEIIAEYYQISQKEASIQWNSGIITVDDVVSMAEDLGYQDDTIAQIKKCGSA